MAMAKKHAAGFLWGSAFPSPQRDDEPSRSLLASYNKLPRWHSHCRLHELSHNHAQWLQSSDQLRYARQPFDLGEGRQTKNL